MDDASLHSDVVERMATAYYAPPRGLRNMRTRATLIWLVGCVGCAFFFFTYDVAMDAAIPAELQAVMRAYMNAVMYMSVAIAGLGGIMDVEAIRRLVIAAGYGLREPAVGEWPATRRRIAQLRANAKAKLDAWTQRHAHDRTIRG